METKNMTIADLKAAYDFVQLDKKELEESMKKNKKSIPAYEEVKALEFELYTELLNRVRDLIKC